MGKISKEEAIKNHRAMWNWIADQYEKGSNRHVQILKREYIDTVDPHRDERIKLHASCYCCYYAGINNIAGNRYRFNCDQCPVVWPSYAEGGMCCEGTSHTIGIGLYKLIEECAAFYKGVDESRDILVKLCRFVADLPENTYNGSMESIVNLAEERDRLIDMYNNLYKEARERQLEYNLCRKRIGEDYR